VPTITATIAITIYSSIRKIPNLFISGERDVN
jgi:hypothetical protein